LGCIQMDSSIAHYWILYLYRGIEDYDIDYMKEVWRIAKESEDNENNVILEEMQYDPRKRLWDQEIDKITELENDLKLNDRDCFREKLSTLDFDMKRMALDMLNIKVWIDGSNVEITGSIPVEDAAIATTSS